MMGGHLSFITLFRVRPDGPQRAKGAGPSLARIASAITELGVHGRRSLRMLDLGCGDGTRLCWAAEQARTKGFVAIEGIGFDMSPGAVLQARRTAARANHPSTGLTFLPGDPIGALAGEQDDSADLVLLPEAMPYPASPLHAALLRVCNGEVLAAE